MPTKIAAILTLVLGFGPTDDQGHAIVMLQNRKNIVMNDSGWPKHLYALDVSRGIAALAVVLWHWQHFAYKGNSRPDDFIRESQPQYELLRLFYEKGGMGVEYFFLLSGFVFFWLYSGSIRAGRTSAWEFSINRFSRLYPLHFVTLIAVAILQYFYISLENVSFVYPFNDVYHFILNIFFASKWGFESGWSFNAPVWSVSIEVLLYGLFFVAIFFHKGGWVFCLYTSTISFVCFHFTDYELFSGIAMFFLGGLLFHAAVFLTRERKSLIRFVYLLAILSWTTVIVNYYIYEMSNQILNIGVLGKMLLAGFPLYVLFPATVLSLALIEIDKGALLKPFSWVGDITYSSYLLHFPLQLLFAIAVSLGLVDVKFYLNSTYLLLYFSVLIPLSYLTFVKFERPSQRAIRAILAPQKPG